MLAFIFDASRDLHTVAVVRFVAWTAFIVAAVSVVRVVVRVVQVVRVVWVALVVRLVGIVVRVVGVMGVAPFVQVPIAVSVAPLAEHEVVADSVQVETVGFVRVVSSANALKAKNATNTAAAKKVTKNTIVLMLKRKGNWRVLWAVDMGLLLSIRARSRAHGLDSETRAAAALARFTPTVDRQ